MVETRSFKNYNKFAFRRDLWNRLNSLNIEAELDPKKCGGKWRNVFTSTADKHVPLCGLAGER